MKLTSVTLVCASLLAVSAPASAQFSKAEDAIKYRQSVMFILGQNVGRLGAMAQGRVPFDAKVAAEASATAEFMAKLPWTAFGEGTDKGGNTRAKAEIWQEKAKFNELAEKLQVETAKLSAAAKTGSVDSIRAAMAGVGGTCKSCHDSFQATR